MRTTGFDPVPACGGQAKAEEVTAVGDSGTSSFVGAEIVKLDRPELTSARILSGSTQSEAVIRVFEAFDRLWPGV